mgnify:CR=1 FL=1
MKFNGENTPYASVTFDRVAQVFRVVRDYIDYQSDEDNYGV